MNRDSGVSFWRRCAGSTPQNTRNQLRFAGFTLGWALVFVGCSFVIKRDLLPEGSIRWVVAALPSVAAVFLVGAFLRFLNEADEFQRLVQLQSLAVGFGGSFFFLTGYAIFERVGAPAIDFSDAAAIMPVLYAVGIFVSAWRYR